MARPATAEQFVGHEELLAAVLASSTLVAAMERYPSALLLSRRRGGKTSVLYACRRRILERAQRENLDAWVVYMDCISLVAEIHTQRGSVPAPALSHADEAARWLFGIREDLAARGCPDHAQVYVYLDEPIKLLKRGANHPITYEDQQRLADLLGRLNGLLNTNRIRQVLFADHLEYLHEIRRLPQLGSRIDQPAIHIPPLSFEEFREALVKRDLKGMERSLYWLYGGFPMAFVRLEDWPPIRSVSNPITRLYRKNGGNTDAAVDQYLMETCGKVLGIHPLSRTENVDLMRNLAAHFFGSVWPDFLKYCIEENDITQLSDLYYGTELLLQIARGEPLFLSEEFSRKVADLLDLIALGYLQVGGDRDAPLRPVLPVDRGLLEKILESNPASPPAPVPSPPPVHHRRISQVVIDLEGGRLCWKGAWGTIESRHARGVLRWLSCFAGPHSIHYQGVIATLGLWRSRSDIESPSDEWSEVRRTVLSSFRKKLHQLEDQEGIALEVNQWFPPSYDYHYRLSLVGDEASVVPPADIWLPTSLSGPSGTLEHLAPYLIARRWQAFLRDGLPDHVPTRQTRLDRLPGATTGRKILAVVEGENSLWYLGIASEDQDSEWDGGKIRWVDGVLQDGNRPGSTLWSPALPSREDGQVDFADLPIGAKKGQIHTLPRPR